LPKLLWLSSAWVCRENSWRIIVCRESKKVENHCCRPYCRRRVHIVIEHLTRLVSTQCIRLFAPAELLETRWRFDKPRRSSDLSELVLEASSKYVAASRAPAGQNSGGRKTRFLDSGCDEVDVRFHLFCSSETATTSSKNFSQTSRSYPVSGSRCR